MAIDTQTKRRSVHGYAGPSAVIAPLVDGAALDEADRRAVAGLYRGITSGAGGTLTGTAGAYISPATVIYTGVLRESVWRIDDLQMYQAIDETSFSVDVATSSGVGRALLIFIATSYMEADTPLSIACGYEACTEIIHEDADRLYVFPDPPAGGASVHFAFGFDVRPVVFVLALSNVDAAALLTADTDTAAAETVDVTADYEASDVLLAMTHSAAIHSYPLNAAPGCHELAEGLPGVLAYHWTNVTMRPIEVAGTDTITVGADHPYSGGGTPTYITLAVRVSQYVSELTGTSAAYLAPTTTIYSGTLEHEGQTLYGTAAAYVAPTTTIYSGGLVAVMVGESAAYVDSSLTIYAGTLAHNDPPNLTLVGFFVGLGMPVAISGTAAAYVAATTTIYTGELLVEQFIEGTDSATVDSTLEIFTGTLSEIYTATGYITAGTIYHS